jgi:hypothetical protein
MISTILAALSFAVTNKDTLEQLGANVVDMFDKARNLVSNDTTSTAAERVTALTKIDAMEVQVDARVEELGRIAPNS